MTMLDRHLVGTIVPAGELVPIPMPADRPVINPKELPEMLGIAEATVYKAIHANEIPSIRLGRRILVPTAELRRMLGLDVG